MGWKERSWYLHDLGKFGASVFDVNGNAGPTIWELPLPSMRTPWMKALRKPRLNSSVVSVAVDVVRSASIASAFRG